MEASFPGTHSSVNLRPLRTVQTPEKVAVFQFTKLGDIYTTLPLVKQLRRVYPESRLLYYTDKKYAGALEPVPEIDRVVTFPVRTWKEQIEAGEFEFERAREWLAEVPRPDLIYNCHDSFRAAVLSELLEPKVAAGLRFDPGEGLVVSGTLFSLWKIYLPYVLESNHLDPYETPDLFSVAQQQLLRFGFEADNSYQLPGPEALPPVEINAARFNLGLILAAGWPTKQWPVDCVKEFIETGRGERTFYLLGGEDVADAGEELAAGRDNVVDLTGQTTLAETAAVLAELDLVISNDTGPLHLAGWLGLPVITLCGPTQIGPSGPGPGVILQGRVDCAGCQSHECRHNSLECLRQIKPELLAELANDFQAGGSLIKSAQGLASGYGGIRFLLREAGEPYNYRRYPAELETPSEIRGTLLNWLATFLLGQLNSTFHPASGDLQTENDLLDRLGEVDFSRPGLKSELKNLRQAQRELEEKWKAEESKVDWSAELPLGPYLAGLGMVVAGRRSGSARVIRRYQKKALESIEKYLTLFENMC